MGDIGHQPPSKRAVNPLFAPLGRRWSLPPLCPATITNGPPSSGPLGLQPRRPPGAPHGFARPPVSCSSRRHRGRARPPPLGRTAAGGGTRLGAHLAYTGGARQHGASPGTVPMAGARPPQADTVWRGAAASPPPPDADAACAAPQPPGWSARRRRPRLAPPRLACRRRRGASPRPCAAAACFCRPARRAARAVACTAAWGQALCPGAAAAVPRGHRAPRGRAGQWGCRRSPSGAPRPAPPAACSGAARPGPTGAAPPGPRRRRWRWGARAVHTPGGERERRATASASLTAPARPARRPAERASSGLGLLCPARRTEAEKAWRGAGPSPSQGRSVGGAISQPRAVPRLPRPAATHAIPRPLRSGAARLPGQRGPGGAATSPWHAPPGRCRQAFPPGGPVARLVPRPRPPREAHPGAGQQCVGVSPGRWRPRGPGRPGGGDPGAVARAAAPCAQAAHSG